MRFACVYFSNGVEPAHWWARGEGASMEIGPGLKPMEPFREDMVFLKGLFNEQAARHKSPHMGRMANMLSGAWVSTDQGEIRVGQTMDQVLAQRLGAQTAVPSLVLGVEPTELRLEDGLSMIYGSCISWAERHQAGDQGDLPRARLRPARRRRRRPPPRPHDPRRGARRRPRPGPAGEPPDRRKLDEYLESVRDIERRIERASDDGRLEGRRPAHPAPRLARPAERLPQDIPDHMRLMLDLIVLAFQMDKTRVATLMLNNDLSQMNFGFLEGVHGSLHLDLTHNGREPAREAMYLKTNQYHVAQFAYLVGRLKAIAEGEGSLLDHSLLMGCSNLFDGDRHQADEMPILLAGRGGGDMPTGRVLDYSGRRPEGRRACGLYLSLMNRMGAPMTRFGDADRPLAEL